MVSLSRLSRVWLRRICSFRSSIRCSRSRSRTTYVPPSSGWFWAVEEGGELGVALVDELAEGVEGDVGVAVAAGAGVGAGVLGAADGAVPGVAALVVAAGAAGAAAGAVGFVEVAGVPGAPPVCAFASPCNEHQAARPKTRNTLLRRMDEP